MKQAGRFAFLYKSSILFFFFLLSIYSCEESNNSSKFTENQHNIIRMYNEVIELKYSDYSKIPKYADSIENASKNEPDVFKALGYISKGIYNSSMKIPKNTFVNYNEAERLLKNSNVDSLKKVVHNGLGNYYGTIGDYPKAFEELLKGLKIAEDEKDTLSIAGLHGNLGNIYQQKGDIELAKNHLNITLALLKDRKHSNAYLFASHIMANIYGIAGDFESALKIDEEGLRISDSIGSNYIKVIFLDNKANCFMYSGQLDSAKVYFRECLRLDLLNGNQKQIADSYSNLAQLAAFSNNENEMVINAEKSISLSKEIEYTPGLTKIYKTLIDFYKTKNKPQQVSEYQDLYLQVYKTLMSERKETAMVQFNTQYETEKKENKLLQYEATVLKKNKQLQFSIVTILALFIISYLFFKHQKTKNQQQEEKFKLKSALSQIENQNMLQQQRLEISRDLHDNIGAQLTCIIASVDHLKYNLADTSLKTGEQLNKINSITKETIVELRDTIWAMNAQQFTFEDLRARILNFIVKIEETHPFLKFEFHIDENLKTKILSSLAGINLYRVLQEAIHNALKHSNATLLTIQVKENEDEITIHLKDNGKGFDLSKNNEGYGIGNMRQRMEDIHANFDIKSIIDSGIEITISCKNLITND